MQDKSYLNFLLAKKLRPSFGENTPSKNAKLLRKDIHLKPIIKKMNESDLLMFYFIISSEGLPGDVIKEVQSNLHEIIMFESNGYLSRSCDSCNDGLQSCDWCDGNGNVECSECDGDGNVSCDTCDGSGEDEEGNPCDECVGVGEKTCDLCGGKKESECDRCNGDGYDTCPDCDGSGDVTDESEVTLNTHYIYTYDPKVVSLFQNEVDKENSFKSVFNSNPMILKNLIDQNKKTLVILNYDSEEVDSSLIDSGDVDDEYFINDILNLSGKNLDDLPGIKVY